MVNEEHAENKHCGYQKTAHMTLREAGELEALALANDREPLLIDRKCFMSFLNSVPYKDPLDAIRAALLDGSKTPVQCDAEVSLIRDLVDQANLTPDRTREAKMEGIEREIDTAQIALDEKAHVDWLGYRHGIHSARLMSRRYLRRKMIDDQMLKHGRHDNDRYWLERWITRDLVKDYLAFLEAREFSDGRAGVKAGHEAGLKLLRDTLQQDEREYDIR